MDASEGACRVAKLSLRLQLAFEANIGRQMMMAENDTCPQQHAHTLIPKLCVPRRYPSRVVPRVLLSRLGGLAVLLLTRWIGWARVVGPHKVLAGPKLPVHRADAPFALARVTLVTHLGGFVLHMICQASTSTPS